MRRRLLVLSLHSAGGGAGVRARLAAGIKTTAQNAMSRKNKCLRVTFYFLATGRAYLKPHQEDC